MDRLDGRLVVSASDLVGHLACGHLSGLDLAAVHGRVRRPTVDDAELQVLQRRGLEHEAAHLAVLRATGATIIEIADLGRPDRPGDEGDRRAALLRREAETVAAMRTGVDVVFQATFFDETAEVVWRGHADFLRKVDRPTRLGGHGYEPEDTKLARHVKPSAVLQLCQYAEQVAWIQGSAPESVHVVLGGCQTETIRLADVAAYYRAAQRRFLAALAEERTTYPLPVADCPVCQWQTACAERWEHDDHLSRVASLSGEQARKLEAAGVSTLTALAGSASTLPVPGIGAVRLARLRQQARLQAARRPGQPPPVELVCPVEAGRGLATLPAPDPGDLFYDIEGDPYVGRDGIEYLHGVGWLEGDQLVFRAFWAHTPRDERRAFEDLIDLVVERRRRHPAMHVYHYASYEPSALGRLMGRYGTRESELDDLLRGEVFVDLYRAVRQGLIVGSPSYSLKKLEPLYMEARTGAITDAASSIVEYEQWLQTSDPQILRHIEAYNRDDVESTWRLRDWLEERRRDAVRGGATIVRPGPVLARTAETAAAVAAAAALLAEDALVARLLDGRVDPPSVDPRSVDPRSGADDDESRARWLMAHLLKWHQREDKPEWWRFFDRVLRCDEDELFADTEAIAGLRPVGPPVRDKQSFVWTYEFDPQEHKLGLGTTPADPVVEREQLRGGVSAPDPGTLVGLDPAAGTLQLRRGVGSEARHPTALIPGGPLRTSAQRTSLRGVAEALLAHGIDGAGPAAAARQLLARRPPRVAGVAVGDALRRPDERAADAAVRLARGLEHSYLPVQGPPGSGKTWTAAAVIVALVADGHRVGITANSHAVISNLLRRVVEVASDGGIECRAIQRVDTDGGVDHPAVTIARNNGVVEAALADRAVDVVAGTAWLFARPELQGQLHTLVVDEAGQLSLANVVAVAPAADNLILVGDPRQLAQPSKGTHPAGAEVSALEHVLAGTATVADHEGLFLDRTWRLHPEICAFISEQVYDERLRSEPECARQEIGAGPTVAGSGLRWLPVEHAGNRTSSDEEATAVDALVRALIGRPWTNRDGWCAPLTIGDLLVVAPYNAEVNLLARRLPSGARIGTVDRFQGQQAAVVLVSLAASSAEDVPRGIDFLYSRNRLNVAVSRAQAMCIVVASPALLAVRCRTVEQMRLANVLCRYVELADDVSQAVDSPVPSGVGW